MATNRITYGQSAIAVSQPPANSDNTYNLTGLKRVQSAALDFSFARQRFKQLGDADYVGQVPVKNSNIGFSFEYFYSNGTNEALMGLDVDGAKRGVVNYIQKENQDRNYYIIMGTGENQEPNMLDTEASFKNKFNVMALGNVFLNSYSLSVQVGGVASASVDLSAYNVVLNEYNDANGDGQTIPAINNSKPAGPVMDKNYKISTGIFENTTNRDGNITSAFGVGDIQLTLPVVKEPGLQFTGNSPEPQRANLASLDLQFGIQREDLYGLGSMYPYGRRAVLPSLGKLAFSAVASEFTSGNLNAFLTGSHNYDFIFDLVNPSGQTGLRIEVEGAQMTDQGLSEAIGTNANIEASFDFSVSPTSGLRMSTPPLIIGQPASVASAGAILYVQPTGKTSEGAAYHADGFKYQWYKNGATYGPNSRSVSTTDPAGPDSYYVVVSNELGSATSNSSTVS